MASVPHWDDIEGSWDHLALGETSRMPGVWTVDGSAARDLDVKPRPQQDAAKVKNKGYRNASLTLTGRLRSQDDLAALEIALGKLHPRRKGSADEALKILHPKTTLLGVKFVIVERIHTADLDDDQILTQRIDVLEFVPKPKAKAGGKPKLIQVDIAGILDATASTNMTGQPLDFPPSAEGLNFIPFTSFTPP